MTIFQSIFNKIPSVLIVLFAITLFASCEKEEPEVPQDEDITFKIDLLKMAALDIKDAEGDALEIYGAVSTKLLRDNITESNELWNKAFGEAVAVGYSDVPMSSSVTFTVATSNLAASNLEVSADLFDQDGSDASANPPEDLGKETLTTPLANITSSVTYQLVLNDSAGQEIEVTYSITRL